MTNISNESKPTYTLNISGGKTLGTTADTATPFYIVMPNGEYKISAEIFDNAETPVSICSFTTSSEQEFGDISEGRCVNMAAKEVAISGEAKIATTVYNTLAEAITDANATSGATIELLKNVTIADATLSISANMTIDLNGFSITCSKPNTSGICFPFLVTTSNISLTFKNGVFLDATTDMLEFDNFIVGESLGSFGSKTYTLNLTNVDFGVFDASGNCTAPFRTKGNNELFSGIANATFTNVRVGTNFSVIYDMSSVTNKITVKGGKYVINGNNTKANSAFHFENGTNVFDAVTIDFTSDYSGSSCVCGPATIKNCNFTSNHYAVCQEREYNTTIDGGTYRGDEAAVQVTQGTVTINSGTLTSDDNVLQTDGYYDSPNPYYAQIYVNDGQFKGAIVKKAVDVYNTIELKGGIYSADPSAYVATGYTKEDNDDESTKVAYPYKVIADGGPVGGGLGDINKTTGSW